MYCPADLTGRIGWARCEVGCCVIVLVARRLLWRKWSILKLQIHSDFQNLQTQVFRWIVTQSLLGAVCVWSVRCAQNDMLRLMILVF